MSFKSCPMFYHGEEGAHDHLFDWPPGHFYWEVEENGNRFLWIVIPRNDLDVGGRPGFCCLPIRPHQGSIGASWEWDGNVQKPTLTPSVFHDPHRPDSPFHWHGFVTAGELKGCP